MLHYIAALLGAAGLPADAVAGPYIVRREDEQLMAGLLLATVLIAGFAVELVIIASWFKWPY